MNRFENTVDPESVRQAMRQWTTGVCIVTSCHDSIQHGMTVSSFTSVSLSPPQVMVALSRSSRTHGLIEASNVYGVTILALEQQDISDRFAGRAHDDENRFAGLKTFKMVTESPFLSGGLAYLDCEVERKVQFEEHTLFFGRVVAMQLATDGQPLVYHNRNYHRLYPDD